MQRCCPAPKTLAPPNYIHFQCFLFSALGKIVIIFWEQAPVMPTYLLSVLPDQESTVVHSCPVFCYEATGVTRRWLTSETSFCLKGKGKRGDPVQGAAHAIGLPNPVSHLYPPPPAPPVWQTTRYVSAHTPHIFSSLSSTAWRHVGPPFSLIWIMHLPPTTSSHSFPFLHFQLGWLTACFSPYPLWWYQGDSIVVLPLSSSLG